MARELARERVVDIDYTNWKGVRSVYRILPHFPFYGNTEHHTEHQWLWNATVLATGQRRTFAAKDIHSWTPAPDAVLPWREGEQPGLASVG